MNDILIRTIRKIDAARNQIYMGAEIEGFSYEEGINNAVSIICELRDDLANKLNQEILNTLNDGSTILTEDTLAVLEEKRKVYTYEK